MSDFDVIVLGLGGIGSAAAYHVARRGRRVAGFDRHNPPNDHGSTHGESRIIRQAYFEHPDYVPLLLRAYELWRELDRATGEKLLHITGGLMLGAPGSEVVAGSLRSARQHGLRFELLEAADIRRRYPPFAPAAGEIGLFESEAGFVLPERGVQAHLDAARHAGAELHTNEPVLRWSAEQARVMLETTRGRFTAARLIVAPGAWAPGICRSLGLSDVPLTVTRNVMLWFEPVGGVEQFRPERFPIYIWQPAGERAFYGFPALGGLPDGVKVAIHGSGVECTPETVDREIHAGDVDVMRSFIAKRIPRLNGKFLQARTCLYTNTPDAHFLIGVSDESANVCYAVGFSGHGYKFAPVMGEILADLALDGGTRHPIELFSPERFREGTVTQMKSEAQRS